jgi:outer membrane lipoprotein
MRLLLPIAVILIFTVACAPTVSRQSLGLVEPEVTFQEVVRNPDRYVGQFLLLGGSIVSVHIDPENGSELEIVQLPTDGLGRITTTDRSAGRFIARDEVFRDPAVYHPRRLITLVGRVEGSKPGRIGEADYRYPVLSVHELHLWAPGERPGDPRVRFGIGIGIGITR